LDALSLNDLRPYYQRLDLIRETAAQIEKDFGHWMEPLRLSGDPDAAYDELMDLLQPVLNNLLNNHYEQLLHVLYRIDIPERKLIGALKSEPEKPQEAVIAHLVIERELKKVVLRHYFRER